jgi:hypothetical protein
VAGSEWNTKTIHIGVGQAMDGVSPEIVVLPLLAVGDDRRSGHLEALDGVANCLLEESVEAGVVAVGALKGRDEGGGARQAADWLS